MVHQISGDDDIVCGSLPMKYKCVGVIFKTQDFIFEVIVPRMPRHEIDASCQNKHVYDQNNSLTHELLDAISINHFPAELHF